MHLPGRRLETYFYSKTSGQGKLLPEPSLYRRGSTAEPLYSTKQSRRQQFRRLLVDTCLP